MNVIELSRLSVGYHGEPVLAPVDLTIRRGMFLGVIGPNGSGKTTLVRTILGLLRPVGGTIRYTDPHLRFGYVPQRDVVNLSFPLTAFEITLMGRYGRISVGRRPGEADREAARRALREVGAEALAERPFHALSGGQRQRVLIARALAGEPGVLVLDEPTTGMDLPSEKAMLDLVASFCKRDLAVIMVSHHLGAVADYATDLCLLAGQNTSRTGAERVVETGPRSEMLTSERLSRIYGVPVTVARTGSHSAVFLDDNGGESGPEAGR